MDSDDLWGMAVYDDIEAALARIDCLLHELTPKLAPAVDEDGDVSDEAEVADSMALNTWGLVMMFSDYATGENYTRLIFPPQLPSPFLKGLLCEAIESL